MKDQSKKIAAEFVKAALKTMRPEPYSDPLSELELKKIENRAFARSMEMADHEALDISDEDALEGFRLAAAPAEQPVEQGRTGVSWGVAVDEKGEGALIRITAWIGESVREHGSLEVVAPEVKGVTRNDKTYLVTPPSEFIRNALLQRLRTIPCLAPLQLQKRDVSVEVDWEAESFKFLDKGESLVLAAIVAIVKAVTGRSGRDKVVYSAGVGINGQLTRVGRIAEKTGYVLRNEGFLMVVSPENYDEISPGMDAGSPGSIKRFASVEEVCGFFLGMPLKQHEGRKALEGSVAGGPEAFGFLQILVVFFAVALFIGALLSNNLLVPAHLIVVGYLAGKASQVFEFASLMKVGLVFITSGLISALATVGLNAGLRKHPKYLIPLRRIIRSVNLVFFVYCAVILSAVAWVFYTCPDPFQKYEKIEYLRSNPSFQSFVRDVPDFRFVEFKRLSASIEPEELARAVEVGAKIRPSDSSFKDSFVGLASLLMDRVHRTGFARQAVFDYVDYERSIRDRKDAEQFVADTFDSARDLIDKYGLRDEYYGEMRLGVFIDETSARYGL